MIWNLEFFKDCIVWCLSKNRINMSQAAFSLLTAGIKFKGIKENEKDIFKKGSNARVDNNEY